MRIHVLPGDSLVETFRETKLEGEVIVCRECLIEGEVKSETLAEFWQIRTAFIVETYDNDANNYREKVVSEFEKLLNLDDETEVNLWFEYELFCQTNMWFCLSLLNRTKAQVFRVQPIVRNDKDIWQGFGGLEKEDLHQCFAARTRFSQADLTLGADLWKAYQTKDFAKLTKLAETNSECFPKLKEVCQAETEKHKRPANTLQKIISNGETRFGNIFQQFSEIEGIYGFGDSQVKRIYNQIVAG